MHEPLAELASSGRAFSHRAGSCRRRRCCWRRDCCAANPWRRPPRRWEPGICVWVRRPPCLRLGTGLGAVLDLDVSAAARQAISAHLKWAMFTTLLLVLLAVWRGAGTASRSRPSWLFLIVLVGCQRRADRYRLPRRQKRLRVRSGCQKNRRAALRGTARRDISQTVLIARAWIP